MISEGKQAPSFNLNDQSGKAHSLEQYRGSWVVLYFYPKDMTPGCTQEACDFRDNLARISSVGAVVLGVSADSEKRHTKFAEKESLNFPLLADVDHATCEAYDAWKPKKMMGHEFLGIVRSTFIIDPQGVVRKVYSPVSVKGHVDEVLRDLKALQVESA